MNALYSVFTDNKGLCKLVLVVFNALKGITSGLSNVNQVFAVTKVHLPESTFLIMSLLKEL